MRAQITWTLVLTVIAARLLYGCRACTFAVWTNAAMISRIHGVLAVATIELAIVAVLAVAAWFLVEFVRMK